MENDRKETVADGKESRKKQKELIKFLEGLREKALSSFPADRYRKYRDYYNGTFERYDNPNLRNQNNLIKRIVDTKSTLVLDNNITTSIVPSILSMRDIQSIESARGVADILEDAKNNVLKSNKIKTLNQEIIENSKIDNLGVVMLDWDQSLDRGLGNIKLTSIDPVDFMPEPTAKEIDDCNYIFVRSKMSAYTLKKRYPSLADKIDKMAGKSGNQSTSMGSVKGMTTVTNTENTQQMYVYDTKGLESSMNEVTTYIAFLKDDSVYLGDEKDSDSEEIKKVSKLRYPYGRFVMYADDIVFEDKPIDYRFGFPISVLKMDPGKTLLDDGGEVKDLINIQDRVNLAYKKRAKMVGDFVSYIMVDPESGLDENDMVNQTVIMCDPGTLRTGVEPRILTNNTIAELSVLNQYINDLKADALEIAGVNESILSGKRQEGVNSGDMVEALNESPLTGIRQDQRNFEMFFIDMNKKIVEMIQRNYSVERIIRTSTGYAQLPIRGLDESEIVVFNENLEELKRIKGDLTVTDFNVDIIAGSEIPRSRTQFASLTMQLWQQGIFSAAGNIQEKSRILEALDYPDRRAIIKEIEAQQEAMSQGTPPPEVKEMTIGFKDLEFYPEAQVNVLKQLGLVAEKTEEESIEESAIEKVNAEMAQEAAQAPLVA